MSLPGQVAEDEQAALTATGSQPKGGGFGLSKAQLETIVEDGFANGSKITTAGVTVASICADLGCDANTGLTGADLEKRRQNYGRNFIEPPPATGLLELMWGALQDPILILLLIAAVVNLQVHKQPAVAFTFSMFC